MKSNTIPRALTHDERMELQRLFVQQGRKGAAKAFMKLTEATAQQAIAFVACFAKPADYVVLRDRWIGEVLCATVLTRVYELVHSDYGSANTDTCATGIRHVSVTLDPTGNYPFFTIPHNYIAELIR